MNTRLNKLLPLAGVACCFSTSLLLAAPQYGGNDSGNCCPPKRPEPVCEPPCDEVTDRTLVFDECTNNFRKGFTPDAGPRVACGADFFITADFIYWTSRLDGLGYAQTSSVLAAGAGVANLAKGSVQHPDFGWDPGFKVGLGYNLDHDGWDLFAEYTWLRPDDTDSTSSSANPSRLTALWTSDNSVLTDLRSARSSWNYDLNVVDLELGRNFFVSRDLTLRPHFGLKGTWQNHEYRVVYAERDPAAPDADLHKVSIDQDYWGVGLRTGMDTVWYFNQYFGIYGDFALAALWSKFDVDRTDTDDTVTGGVTTASLRTLNVNNEFYSLKYVFEIVLGLRGDVWFSDDAFHLGFHLGWEMQYWPSQNQFFRYAEECAHGDLNFMGLTTGVRFDF